MKRKVEITVDPATVPADGDKVYINGVYVPGITNANASSQSPDGKSISFHLVGFASSVNYGVLPAEDSPAK